MKLEIIMTGDKSGHEGSVCAEGNMLNICAMLLTGILELYEDFEKSEGPEAAGLFRMAIHKYLSDSLFPGIYEAFKRDTAVPMAAPGYIQAPAQK